MGYLAGYIRPCYESLLQEKMADQIIAIKGSERGLEEKQREFPFPIRVQRTKETLEELKPDLILLASKPFQIPQITEEILVPYYESCRQAGETLPDLYSFAPDPVVSYFYDTLGPDVNEANLLPNMIDQIHGIPVAQVGVSFVSFDERREWPEENRQLAMDFLKPTGTVVEVRANLAVPFLALQVASHVMYEFTYIIQDCLAGRGKEVSLAQAASVMRACNRGRFTDIDPELVPCSRQDLPEDAADFVDLMMRNWYDGILDFALSVGIDEQAARRNIGGTMEVYALTGQFETREVMKQSTANHATPGGVLEKCMHLFMEYGYGYLTEKMEAWLTGKQDPACGEEIRRIAAGIARKVSDHGQTLGGKK